MNDILNKPFLKSGDLMKLFDVKKTTACGLMKKVKIAENIDEERLPVRHCIPTIAVKKYFQLDGRYTKKPTMKINNEENKKGLNQRK